MLKKSIRRVTAILLLAATGSLFWLFMPVDSVTHNFSGLQGDVQRGAYLARMSGCFACHTDYAGGGKVFAGGGPVKTPFGTFYAPNITTDTTYGIGGWTLQDFSAALVEGVSPDGEHYFPVFPYENYRYFSKQDIVDLWVAFRTVPAIKNRSPQHQISIPFNQRFLLAAWKKLFLQDLMPEFAGPGRKELARGSYIVNGPGHCVSCHTPRNLFGGLQLQYYLEGGEGSDQESVPPITKTALSQRGYTKEETAYVLKDGITPDGDVLGGTMGEIITHNAQWLSDQDRDAIAEYLWQVEKRH